MKKLIVVFLCFFSFVFLFVPNETYGSSSGTYGSFRYVDDGTSVKITCYIGPNSGSVSIPYSINGHQVVAIGSSAFWHCNGLTSITIPYGVTDILSDAFSGCSGLTTITIPNSVQVIEDTAFYGCSSLVNLVIPSSVFEIGERAFGACSGIETIIVDADSRFFDSRDNCNAIIDKTTNSLLIGCKSTIIPSTVTSIYKYAFWGCSELTSITIPSSVTSIGEYAFWECTALTSVEIPSTVTTIGGNPFANTIGLTDISVDANNPNYDSRNNCNAIIETASNSLIVGCKNTIIPENVTSIGYSAFYNCSDLTSVTIPEGTTNIGVYAFYGCSELTNITIPSTVTNIEEGAFKGCNGLTSVTLPVSTSLGQSVFYECSNIGYIHLLRGTSGIWSLKQYCFQSSCENIKEVVLDYGIATIGNFAFNGFSSITSIEIPNSVYSIGQYAFAGCSSLTSVNIPSAVTEINYGTFKGCSSLKNIALPQWVTSIGDSAFKGCSVLTNLIIPSKVTSIGEEALSGCIGLTNLIIPSKVTNIGQSAFAGCMGLTSVTILSEEELIIGEGAFGGCTNLKDLTIPISSAFKKNSFEGCSSIEYLRLTKGNGSWCMGIGYLPWNTAKQVIIDDDITYLGYSSSTTTCSCFSFFTDLQILMIPASCTASSLSFEHCESIEQVFITKGTGEWKVGSPWYHSRGSIKVINIADGITSIGSYAFRECTASPIITIPSSVTGFGKNALYGCNGTLQVVSGSYAQEYAIANGIRFSNTDNLDMQISNGKLTVYSIGAVPNYQVATQVPWYSLSTSITEVEVCEDTTYLGHYFFRSLSNLNKVTIKNGEIALGYKVFPDKVLTIIGAGGDALEAYCNNDINLSFDKMQNPNIPESPVVSYITPTSITLQAIEGYEYSINGTEYYDDPIFENLEIGKTYSFYQRIKDNVQYKASVQSNKTDGTTLSDPNAPTFQSLTSDNIQLTSVEGYEYSRDGITWQDSFSFANLNQNTLLLFYQRLKETENHSCSNTSPASKAIIIGAPELLVLDTQKCEFVYFEGFEFSIDGVTYQTSPVFDDYPPFEFTAFQRLNDSSGVSVCFDDSNGAATFDGAKAAPAITSIETTENSIVVSANGTCLYSIDGDNWQTSNIFSDIDFTETYRIWVKNSLVENGYQSYADVNMLVGIEISKNPKKLIYETMVDNFESDGGMLRLIYEHGERTIALENSMISGFDNTQNGINELSISYAGKSTTLQVTIANKMLSSIVVNSNPIKLSYLEAYDTLDLTGGKITKYYNNNTSSVVDLSEATITGFDNTKVGKQTLTATLNGKTATFEVTIVAKSLTSIAVTTLPTKASYLEAFETLNLAGGKITKYFNNDTTEVVDLRAASVAGFDNTKVGKQTLTATLEEKSATFEISIMAKSLQSIAITTNPTKVSYLEAYDALNLAGGKVTKYYNNQTSEEADLSEAEVIGFDNTIVGKQTIIVMIGGKTCTLEITIEAKSLSSIAITTPATKLSYLEAYDALDLSGGKITKYFNNGTSEVVDLDSAFVTDFDNTVVGVQTLTVTIDGITSTFDVNIVPKSLDSIEMLNGDNPIRVKPGGELNLEKVKVKLLYNNETYETRSVQESEISAFDNLLEEIQEIFVTIGEKVTSFFINVINYLTGDFNEDDEITDADAVYLLYSTFFPEEYPLNQGGDFNNDSEVTDADAVYLLYHTFFPEEYPID